MMDAQAFRAFLAPADDPEADRIAALFDRFLQGGGTLDEIRYGVVEYLESEVEWLEMTARPESQAFLDTLEAEADAAYKNGTLVSLDDFLEATEAEAPADKVETKA